MHDKELGDRKWEVFNLTCLEFRGLTEKIELYIVKKEKGVTRQVMDELTQT